MTAPTNVAMTSDPREPMDQAAAERRRRSGVDPAKISLADLDLETQAERRRVWAATKQDPYLAAAREFVDAPTHGAAADVLAQVLRKTHIAERLRLDGAADFYQKTGPYHEPALRIREDAREILEDAVRDIRDAADKQILSKEIHRLYEKIGKAISKARTRDFVTGALSFLADMLLVPGGRIPWNTTPEAIPCLDAVLDFSGDTLQVRDAKPTEYFRNPAPCRASDIIAAARSERFAGYLASLFSNPDTRRSARDCLSACISCRPTKTFFIWTNDEGDGGKDTLYGLVSSLVPGRTVMAKNALILHGGDKSEKRFGEIEMQGRAAVFFNEVSGTFDVAQVKNYTGLSNVRGEAKGRDSVEFPQTWAMVAMCNRKPKFDNAQDGGFLGRVFVLPFSSIFYADEDDRLRRLELGDDPAKLHPAADKAQLLDSLLEDRAAILRELAENWIIMRKERDGKPWASPECRRAGEEYRAENDTTERFFREYLVRRDGAFITYEAVRAAWKEYTGRDISARDIAATLTKRYSFIEAAAKGTHGARGFRGIALRDTNPEPEKPRKDDPEELFPAPEVAQVAQNPIFISEDEKSKKVYMELKTPLCATSATQSPDAVSQMEEDPLIECTNCTARAACKRMPSPGHRVCEGYVPDMRVLAELVGT